MKKLVQGDRAVRCSLFFAAYITASCLCFASERSPRYSVIPLGTPITEFEGSEDYLQPTAINNRGDVIGFATHGPFLYRDGAVRLLWSEDDPYWAYHLPAINNRGTIAGLAAAWEPDPLPPVATFTYSTAGRNADLNFARVSVVASRWFFPYDINDRGAIAGDLWDGPTDHSTAAVYQHGQLQTLPSLAPRGDTSARAINNRGQIIGTSAAENFLYPFLPARAVIWSHGRVHDLGLLPDCANAWGADINDRGEAVGSCDDAFEASGFNASFSRGFIYRNGKMSRIPAPAYATFVSPTHINNAGDILINYFPRWHPEVYGYGFWLYSDGVFHDLDQIVSDATGWRVVSLGLYDMNDRGAIVGVAQYDHRDGRFLTQGILLVPRHSKRGHDRD